jgi:hypothetical protein
VTNRESQVAFAVLVLLGVAALAIITPGQRVRPPSAEWSAAVPARAVVGDWGNGWTVFRVNDRLFLRHAWTGNGPQETVIELRH